MLKAFTKCIDQQRGGALLDLPELKLEVLDEQVSADKGYLQELESVHKALVLYLWLSYRFAGVFTSRAMARYVKELVEERIDKVLADYAHDKNFREKLKIIRQQSQIRDLRRQLFTDRNPQETAVNDDTRDSPWADIPWTAQKDPMRNKQPQRPKRRGIILLTWQQVSTPGVFWRSFPDASLAKILESARQPLTLLYLWSVLWILSSTVRSLPLDRHQASER